jgi:hypothetical protein
VWVPFTSESKEAIADYDEIRKEMKLALMECGRKLGTYLRKRQAMRREAERRDIFERYIGEIAQAVNAINGTDAKRLYEALLAQAKKRTAIADVALDEEGRAVKEDEALRDDDGVIIVESAIAGPGPETAGGDTPPVKLSKAEAAMLKVHATREDDQPSLIETQEVGRSNRSGKPEKKKSLARPKGAPAAKGRSSKVRTPEPPAERSTPADTAKPAKPKLRLVNGKLVPAEQGPRLF